MIHLILSMDHLFRTDQLVLAITHRLLSVDKFDKIVVLKDGRSMYY